MQGLAPPTDRNLDPRYEANAQISGGLGGLGQTTQLIVISQSHEIDPIGLGTLNKDRRRQRAVRIKRMTMQIRINGMRIAWIEIAGQVLTHG